MHRRRVGRARRRECGSGTRRTARRPANGATRIDRDLRRLDEQLRSLRKAKPDSSDPFADAEAFRKGVEWAIRYETKLEPADVALVEKAPPCPRRRARRLRQ